MRRRLLCLLAGVAAVALLPACGDRDTTAEEVRALVARTDDLAGSFVYVDERFGDETRVAGIVEDDLRYKAQVTDGDQLAFEEVVHDDILAMRFLDPAKIDDLVASDILDEVSTETELEGIDVFQVLASGRWVIDPTGAPPPSLTSAAGGELGTDPVFDAITALDYVERAVGEAAGVERYSPDDLSPAYAASEDPFPKPDDGADIIRYDLVRPSLPAISAITGTGAAAGESEVLSTRHFRKMAVYVRDGRVVKVLERIEVVGKGLEELEGYVKRFLKEAKLPPALARPVLELVERDDLPEERKGRALLQGLNSLLEGFGQEQILIRSMSLELSDIGRPQVVALPEGDVVLGSLAGLVTSGKAKAEGGTADADESGEGGDGGAGGDSGGEEPDAAGEAGTPGGGDPVAGPGG